MGTVGWPPPADTGCDVGARSISLPAAFKCPVRQKAESGFLFEKNPSVSVTTEDLWKKKLPGNRHF